MMNFRTRQAASGLAPANRLLPFLALTSAGLWVACGDDMPPDDDIGGPFPGAQEDAAMQGAGDASNGPFDAALPMGGSGGGAMPMGGTPNTGGMNQGTGGLATAGMGGSLPGMGGMMTGGMPGSGGVASGTGGTGSPACLSCMKAMCNDGDFLLNVGHPITGEALTLKAQEFCFEDESPPPGFEDDPLLKMQKRNSLCQAVLACLDSSSCAQSPLATVDYTACICGSASEGACVGGSGNGPCKEAFEGGIGSKNAEIVLSSARDPVNATGMALYLDESCRRGICKDACSGAALPMGGSSGSMGGNSGSGGMNTGGMTSGMGGVAMGGMVVNTGGSSMGGAVVNMGGATMGGATTMGGSAMGGMVATMGGSAMGGMNAGGAAMGGSGPVVTFPQCNACRTSKCEERFRVCDDLSGVAQAGPGQGRSKVELCKEARACALANACASDFGEGYGDPQPCYCGTATATACLGGGANGPCKDVIEAAAETTDGELIGVRFYELDFAVGAAMSTYASCDYGFCREECIVGVVSGGSEPDAGTATSDAAMSMPDAGSSTTDAAVATPDAGMSVPDAAIADAGGVTADAGMSMADGGSTSSCPDLNDNQIPDCTETKVKNATFDTSTSDWSADFVVELAHLSNQDGSGNDSSGALSVTNASVVNAMGIYQGGARQCVTWDGSTPFDAAAQVYLLPGQISASAAIAVLAYASPDCTGTPTSLSQSGSVSSAGAWSTARTSATPPANTKSLAVRLAVTKNFMAQPATAWFDNVLLR